MGSFAPPPGPQLEPFAVPGPQVSDPLQAIAEYHQMRNQNLLAQQRQVELQQHQMELQSNQALLKAMAAGGGDFDKTYNLAAQSGQVLPTHLAALQEHHQKYLTDAQQYEEGQRKALAADTDRYRGLLDGVTDQPSLDTANQKAQDMGVFKSGKVAPMTTYIDDTHLKAYSNSLRAHSTILGEAKTQAEIDKEKAQAGEATQKGEQAAAETVRTQQQVRAGERAEIGQEMQAAERDQSGLPTPAAWARIRGNHPKVVLPDMPTQQFMDNYQASLVGAKDQPEYQLNKYKAQMGLLGNNEYDQFLVQYARKLNKTPLQLTAQEALDSFPAFARYKQDPQMFQLALETKQLAETQARLQGNLMPTNEDIDTLTTALLNHKLSPTQFNELRTSRANVGGKVFTRALQRDPNFSLTRAESEFKAMEGTEKDFTSGKEAGLVRSNNNALEHLDLLDQARQAMKNGDLQAMNRVARWLSTQTGSDVYTVFDHIAERVGDEVSKAFVPGGGSAAERQAAGAGYNSKMSDDQIARNIRADVHLMDSQQRGLKNQYDRGTYGQGTQKLFTDEAMAARNRLLGGAAAVPIRIKGGDGNIYPFNSEAEAQRFEQRIKAKGGTTTRLAPGQ